MTRIAATVTMTYEVEFEDQGPDTLATPHQALLATRKVEAQKVVIDNIRVLEDA